MEIQVEVGDVSLYTRSLGAGPDVVVLHGGPGAHHDYLLPQFDALATGRRLRYYDQRGGGRSPAERHLPLRWDTHVADLAALLDLWHLDRTTLLGYSWGGLLAMLFAIANPARVERLALVSPAPATATGRKEFERRFAARMGSGTIATMRAELAESGLRDRDPDTYRQRAFELSVAGYFADPARARDLTPFRVTGRTQQAVWNSLGDYDIRGRLDELEIPSLVVHGQHDPIPLDTAADTARRLGAELVVLEHSGHVPYVEEPDRFVSTLNAFLPAAA